MTQPAETHADQRGDVVELRMPADGAYLALLRTATAGLASRCDFTLDEIEDLQIAVDEASALLLADAKPDTDLCCAFTVLPEGITVTTTVASRTGRVPRQHTFAWTVLNALAGDVDTYVGPDGKVSLTLHKKRGGTR